MGTSTQNAEMRSEQRQEQGPHNFEGFFDDLPTFENKLDSDKSMGSIETSRGAVYREVFEMQDGTRYPAVTGVPNAHDSDTAVVFTTAWMTATRGHNMRTLMRAMKAGYTAIMIGPEEELRNTQKSAARRLIDAPLTSPLKVAWDMNRILDDVLLHLNVRQDEIITLGESRGAMLAHGFNIEEYSGPRRIVYGDLTAPCFARPPKLTELPAVAGQLVPEALTLAKLGIRLAQKPVARHYRGTAPGDIEYYPKELTKIPQLLGGFAGKIALCSMQGRPDTQLHVRIFEGDGWSQSEEWKKLYQPYLGSVTLELCEGYHLDIASGETLDNIELRLKMLAEMRGYDGSYENVDFNAVKTAHLSDEVLDLRAKQTSLSLAAA